MQSGVLKFLLYQWFLTLSICHLKKEWFPKVFDIAWSTCFYIFLHFPDYNCIVFLFLHAFGNFTMQIICIFLHVAKTYHKTVFVWKIVYYGYFILIKYYCLILKYFAKNCLFIKKKKEIESTPLSEYHRKMQMFCKK